LVETLKVALELPLGIATDAGTPAFPLFEDKVTVAPELGATPLRVTVPVAVFPPPIEVGAIVTPVNVAGVTVRVADLLVPLRLAAIVEVTVFD
jgi:hypothetical protein